MSAVIQVLRTLYDQIAQVSAADSTNPIAVIREKGAHADVRVLTWTVSNMCRGGFKTKELWQLVSLWADMTLTQVMNVYHILASF
jgi:hypothetical protein